MTTLLTTELIERCHAGSRAKGFWDETPPKGQQLMLIVSELAEALEAHRKGRPADLPHFHNQVRLLQHLKNGDESFSSSFQAWVKDTPADELADAYIRLCDFAGGYQLRQGLLLKFYENTASGFDAYPTTFGEALLGLTMLVCSIAADDNSEEEGVADALAACEWVATSNGFDLATHIDLKLRYNATRPAKHGKAY